LESLATAIEEPGQRNRPGDIGRSNSNSPIFAIGEVDNVVFVVLMQKAAGSALPFV